jgi:hypothetical protein
MVNERVRLASAYNFPGCVGVFGRIGLPAKHPDLSQ